MPFLPNGVIGGAAALCLLTGTPVHAAAQPAEPVSVWSLSFYKALTYELVANSADVVLYATALSSAAASEGVFAAVNGFTSMATYITHEAAWQHYGPAMDQSADTAVTVGVAKTVSYRAVSAARYLALGYAFTGDPWSSAGFALATAATHTLLYAGNEYLWHVHGPAVQRPAAAPERAVLEAELELQ
ncbi:MAG TPA: DUF2061 domain-containing protein [Azospirillum sp.]|nr:DUF2061 domain-containing protein [Azospirillum sp.]